MKGAGKKIFKNKQINKNIQKKRKKKPLPEYRKAG